MEIRKAAEFEEKREKEDEDDNEIDDDLSEEVLEVQTNEIITNNCKIKREKNVNYEYVN